MFAVCRCACDLEFVSEGGHQAWSSIAWIMSLHNGVIIFGDYCARHFGSESRECGGYESEKVSGNTRLGRTWVPKAVIRSTFDVSPVKHPLYPGLGVEWLSDATYVQIVYKVIPGRIESHSSKH